LKSTPIVVTGASGFVGRAVCEELLTRGLNVHAVARREVPTRPGLTVQKVGRYEDMAVPEGAVCVHLAGENNLRVATQDPERFLDESEKFAEAIAGLPFEKIVYVSSAAVYGHASAVPHCEEEVLDPTHPYPRAKLRSEKIFSRHPRNLIVRLANAYGPGMSDQNVLSDILRQLPDSGPIRLQNLQPVRDYIHVKDVAFALAEIATRPVDGIFNIGSGEGRSVREICSLLCELAGQPEREAIDGLREPPAPSTLILDCDRALKNFGWKARIPLVEGLRTLLN